MNTENGRGGAPGHGPGLEEGSDTEVASSGRSSGTATKWVKKERAGLVTHEGKGQDVVVHSPALLEQVRPKEGALDVDPSDGVGAGRNAEQGKP